VVKAKAARMTGMRDEDRGTRTWEAVMWPWIQTTKKPEIETVSIDALVFRLPDSVQKLQNLAAIVNKFKWEIPIKIWEKTIKLNQEGIEKVTILLS
jgi:hypothetical protein